MTVEADRPLDPCAGDVVDRAVEAPQQSCLPALGRADDREDLVPDHAEVHGTENRPTAVGHVQSLHGEDGIGGRHGYQRRWDRVRDRTRMAAALTRRTTPSKTTAVAAGRAGRTPGTCVDNV